MKQIFNGEVYEALPLSNGIIFSYCKETTEDNKIKIAYKMISFDNGRISDVAKNVYLMSKFGNNYKAIMKYCDNYITVKSIILQNGKILLLSKNGDIKLIDNDSTVTWQGNLNYHTFNASDIVIYKNSLWACFSQCDVLLKYNLNTMHEELRIGGKKSPFQKPTRMFLEGENVIVCNKGSKKLISVNLENYSVFENESFSEEVLQYIKSDIYKFVILDSGLYML